MKKKEKFKQTKMSEKQAFKNYNEHQVVESLKRKHDIKIEGKQIQEIKNGRGDVGIGSKGKIDFLTRYCGYTHFYN